MAGVPSAWTQSRAKLRRCAFRVAAAYLAGAFVVLQPANHRFRRLALPELLRVVQGVLGFIMTVPPAWAHDLGPGGLQRTLPVGGVPAGRTEPRVLPP